MALKDMFSSKKVLNIEIGDRIIEVCETTKAKKAGVKFLSGFMIQTPENAVSDGQINDPEAIADLLKSEFAERGLKNKKVIFTLKSGKVATRDVTLPPMKENKIAGVLETNASDYFPVDMSKYKVTYTLLDLTEKGENPGCRLLAIAAPLNILEGYFQIAALLGVSVEAIDYNGNSQYKAFMGMTGEEVTMYVDVGCMSSGVLILQNDNIMMQRSFACGGDDLIASYINSSGKGENEYVQALRELLESYREDNKVPLLDYDDIIENLDRVIANIERIRDYFNQSNWETPIEKIVLFGICGDITGLSSLVSKRLDVEVEVLNYEMNGYNPSITDEPLSCYISCVGSSIHPVDFIPKEYKKAKSKRTDDPMRLPKLILYSCLGLSALLILVSAAGFITTNSDLKELKAKEAELAYTETVYLKYSAYESELSGFSQLEALQSSPNDSLVAFIGELETKMPSDISVLSATCTRDNVSMNITTTSKESAAKVVQQLRTFESLADIAVEGITDSVAETGIKTVSFAVSCTYGDNPLIAPADELTTAENTSPETSPVEPEPEAEAGAEAEGTDTTENTEG